MGNAKNAKSKFMSVRNTHNSFHYKPESEPYYNDMDILKQAMSEIND